MEARGWQTRALDWAISTTGHRLIQAPPGTGKSYVGYAVAAHWLLRSTDHRVIWAVPSIALCEQAHALAWRHVRSPAFVCRAALRAPCAARFLVTTHQSAVRFLNKAGSGDLLIFDEAHHANQKALANARTCRRHVQCLGLSASPWSPGCDRAFPQRWIYPLSQALADGALLPLVQFEELPDGTAPHTLHFMESVAVAEREARLARALSFVEGDKTERLLPWLTGYVRDLYVCQRLGEGYDVPPCARVVIHKDTHSPIWIYQAVGRALRKHGNKLRGEAYGVSGPTADALERALAWADGIPGRTEADSPPGAPTDRSKEHGPKHPVPREPAHPERAQTQAPEQRPPHQQR